MSYGVTASGFNRKLLPEIADETVADFQAEYGADIDLDPREPLGQLKGIMDERISSLWELAESVYSSLNVNQAENRNLENLTSLNGVFRLPASRSTVIVGVSGSPETVVPVGYEIQKINTPDNVFVCPVETIIPPAGYIEIEFEAKFTGPYYVAASSIEPVVTYPGISGVNNIQASSVGRNVETNSELKLRRKESILNGHSPSDQGIKAYLLANVKNIISVIVISNRTISEVDGRPPKSFEAIVDGGLNGDIAQALYEIMPAGIEPHGDESITITDDEGYDILIEFSKVTERAIEAEIEIEVNEDPNVGAVFPDDGIEQITNNLVEYFSTFKNNQDVINNQTYTPINLVPGVVGITAYYKFKDSGFFTQDNLTVIAKEKVRLAYSDAIVSIP